MIACRKGGSYNLKMFRSILRALFKASRQTKAKPKSKPVRQTLAYKAGHSISSSSSTPKSPPPVSKPRDEVFDATSSHPVELPRVLEGPAYVTDGDTITIQRTQVRLFGIDAPELNHPYGKKAKWAMVRLCKGHRIRAEVTEEDEYGRTVAKCSLPDGRDLSAELVKMGLAIDWPKFSGGQYSHLEVAGIRKKLWLADARQKGRMHVWEKFDERNKGSSEEK